MARAPFATSALELFRRGVLARRNALSSLDFYSGTAAGLAATCSRASTGWYVDRNGALTSFAANVARIGNLGVLIESARTNQVRNGAATGGTVAGSDLPTNWSSVLPGLSQSIIAQGTINGFSYCDIRISGTTTGAGGIQLSPETAGAATTAAAVGQTWTGSLYAALVAGSLANVSAVGLQLRERNAGASTLSLGETAIALTSVASRFSHTRTLASATTAFVQPNLFFTAASGVAVDFTVRLFAPQLEQAASASSPIITTGAAATRAADTVSVPAADGTYRVMIYDASGFDQRTVTASGGAGVPITPRSGSLYVTRAEIFRE